MKKNYIAPKAEVIKIACAGFLAMSGSGGTSGLDSFGSYGGEDDGTYDPE